MEDLLEKIFFWIKIDRSLEWQLQIRKKIEYIEEFNCWDYP